IDRSQLKLGVVRYPNADDVTSSHTQRAGHGILIVGWDDDLAFQTVDKDDKPVVDASGNPVMEKGFYIFKNSWGTTVFGVDNPYGQGYGYISQKYIERYGTAYTSSVPDLSGAPPPPPPTCMYKCSDYGFAPNECYQGYQCDAAGEC